MRAPKGRAETSTVGPSRPTASSHEAPGVLTFDPNVVGRFPIAERLSVYLKYNAVFNKLERELLRKEKAEEQRRQQDTIAIELSESGELPKARVRGWLTRRRVRGVRSRSNEGNGRQGKGEGGLRLPLQLGRYLLEIRYVGVQVACENSIVVASVIGSKSGESKSMSEKEKKRKQFGTQGKYCDEKRGKCNRIYEALVRDRKEGK